MLVTIIGLHNQTSYIKWYLKAERCTMNSYWEILCYVHWCLDPFDHYTGTLSKPHWVSIYGDQCSSPTSTNGENTGWGQECSVSHYSTNTAHLSLEESSLSCLSQFCYMTTRIKDPIHRQYTASIQFFPITWGIKCMRMPLMQSLHTSAWGNQSLTLVSELKKNCPGAPLGGICMKLVVSCKPLQTYVPGPFPSPSP